MRKFFSYINLSFLCYFKLKPFIKKFSEFCLEICELKNINILFNKMN